MRIVDGIRSWGLYLRSSSLEDGGYLAEVAPPRGCTNGRCAHVSHDPIAPDREWRPKQGVLYSIWEGWADEEIYKAYYKWVIPGKPSRYLVFSRCTHYWGKLTEVNYSDLPEWVQKMSLQIDSLESGELQVNECEG